jgi:hypothetical protein
MGFFANFRDFYDFCHVYIYCGRCTQPILVSKKKAGKPNEFEKDFL